MLEIRYENTGECCKYCRKMLKIRYCRGLLEQRRRILNVKKENAGIK